jgi:hypothetical protein
MGNTQGDKKDNSPAENANSIMISDLYKVHINYNTKKMWIYYGEEFRSIKKPEVISLVQR